MFQIHNGELKELFPTGKNLEALVALLDGQFALGRDSSTVFLGKDGLPTQKYGLQWNDVPQVLSTYMYVTTYSYDNIINLFSVLAC